MLHPWARCPRDIASHAIFAVVLGVAGTRTAAQSAASEPPAVTQASDALPPLNLAALYDLAERRSLTVRAARAMAAAAAARVPGARRLPDPQLQFGLMNYTLPSLGPMDPLGMAQVQVMQMVPWPGTLRASGRVAAALADAAEARVEEARWDERARLASDFFDLYQADRALAVDLESQRLWQEIGRSMQTMYTAGDGRQADVLRVQVEAARMSEDIIRLRASRRATAARLTSLLDLPADTTLGAPTLPALPDELPPLAALLSEIEDQRPALRAAAASVRAADQETRLSDRERWPDLQVGLQYGRSRGEQMGSLMVGASIPLYARDRQLRQRDAAAAMRDAAEAGRRALRAETRARAAELHANFERARNLQALYRTTILPQADAAVASTLASYRLSRASLASLLESQLSVSRFQRELIAFVTEQAKALVELEALLGRSLIGASTNAVRRGTL